MESAQRVYDVVLVGGGLGSTLALIALRARRPELSLALIEREAELGGNHTWCFHHRDVPPEAAAWLEPLVVARWPGYSVKFPRRTRRVASPYACITSAQLRRVVNERYANTAQVALYLRRTTREIGATSVLLEDGTRIHGRLIVDARGPLPEVPARDSGFQTFLGLELSVVAGHGLTEPVLMDATVSQRNGLRFMYVLPLDAERVLVEDTYISESAQLDEERASAEIMAYAQGLGLTVRGVLRRESGVLPMPSSGTGPRADASPIVAGYRGGYFHPVTGYSLPLAVRFAEALSRSDLADLADSPLRAFAAAHRRQLRFLFALTRIMFRWFAPEQRFAVLERFYRLPEGLIERFYAAQLTWLDRVRLFWGPWPRGLRLRGLQEGIL
jgi:lycopene beta-cyclase